MVSSVQLECQSFHSFSSLSARPICGSGFQPRGVAEKQISADSSQRCLDLDWPRLRRYFGKE